MGRRRKWLSKVKKLALGSRHKKLRNVEHGKATENEEADVQALRRLEQEPDMLITRTVDENPVVDVPWCILEEPYVVTPVVENVSKVIEVHSGESDQAENASVENTEAVRVSELLRFGEELDEEAAAIRIQTAISVYLAKRKLRDLRGVARLKALMQESSTKRQTAATLQCMQTLSHLQSQIRSRRIRMSEENQALQRQLQQKHEKEVEKMKLTIGDDWNDSTKSKEKLVASLRYRQEAAMRRDRGLAYAPSFQQRRNGSKVADPVFMDPINPHWGWSWLERWMAARPWESTTAIAVAVRSLSVDEISKAYYARHDRHPDANTTKPILIPQRPSRISTSPPSKAPSAPSNPTKLKSPSIKSVDSSEDGANSKTICSVQTCKQLRRHSTASSSMSHSISARTLASSEAHKTRLQKSSSSSGNSYGRLETGSLRSGSAKMPLSSPLANISAARRHSGPPKVELSAIKTRV